MSKKKIIDFFKINIEHQNYKIISLKELNFGKFTITAINNFSKIKYFYKISFKNQYSTKLLINETKIYKNTNILNGSNNFITPKLFNYGYKEKVFYLKLQFINGGKSNYFQFKKISFNSHFKSKTMDLNDYLYRKILILFPGENKILNDFRSHKNLQLDFSHGDYASWNTIIFNKKKYIIDFEQAGYKSINYDTLHWFIAPIMIRISKIPFNGLKKLIFLALKFFPLNRLSKINYFYNFRIDLKIFLIEKIFDLKKEIVYSYDKKDISKLISTYNQFILIL